MAQKKIRAAKNKRLFSHKLTSYFAKALKISFRITKTNFRSLGIGCPTSERQHAVLCGLDRRAPGAAPPQCVYHQDGHKPRVRRLHPSEPLRFRFVPLERWSRYYLECCPPHHNGAEDDQGFGMGESGKRKIAQHASDRNCWIIEHRT